VTPKLGAYAGLAAVALFAALATRRPELVVAAAPFALVAALGLLLARRPSIDAEVELGVERTIEGDEVDVRLTLVADVGAERVEALLQLPRQLVVLGGDNPLQLRLADGERRELRYRLQCARWGAFRVGHVYLRTHDWFGFFQRELVVDRRVPLKVYPSEENVRNLLQPLETQVFAGNQVSRARGEGIEFADLRPFVPGDRVRRINWRATARRGEPWITETHPDRNSDVVVFLDTFLEARTEDEGTLDRAVGAAASLATHYLRE